MVSGPRPLLIFVPCGTGRHIMSTATEASIDLVVAAIPEFTKLNDTDMRWDGSASTLIQGANPTLLINGVLANTVSHVIEVGHIVKLAE